MNVLGSQGLARLFIGWQHTAGSRCGTDLESTVENRQATEKWEWRPQACLRIIFGLRKNILSSRTETQAVSVQPVVLPGRLLSHESRTGWIVAAGGTPGLAANPMNGRRLTDSMNGTLTWGNTLRSLVPGLPRRKDPG